MLKKYSKIFAWLAIMLVFTSPFFMWQHIEYRRLGLPDDISYVDFISLQIFVIIKMGFKLDSEQYQIMSISKDQWDEYEIHTGVMYGNLNGRGKTFTVRRFFGWWELLSVSSWVS